MRARSHISICPISIFIAVQRHSLTMWPPWCEIAQASIVRYAVAISIRIAQMVPPNFRRITRRRSAAVDTVYKLVRNWQYVSPIRLSTFGGHFRECSTRSLGKSLLRYFRRSKFPREPCVRKADMILREFN